MLKPQRLQAGDRVAAISLSWGAAATFPQRYALGKQQLEATLGLQVVETPHALRDPDWLQRNPQARADDLMGAFADPAIKGIIAIIGGEDSIRTLPYLDLAVLATHPKVFLGYSDTTITHFACWKAGLTSFYGPAIMTEFAENGGMMPYIVDSLRRTLFSADVVGEVTADTLGYTSQRLEWGEPANQLIRRRLQPAVGWRWLQGQGRHQGRLIGGCLEVLDWLRGTDFFPPLSDWDGAILFLETSEEMPPPHQVTRFLRSLAAMGIVERLGGLLYGRPYEQDDPRQWVEYDDAILKAVRDEAGRADLPIVTHMDFGHTSPQFVLPYGIMASIDCEQQRFHILESAVR